MRLRGIRIGSGDGVGDCFDRLCSPFDNSISPVLLKWFVAKLNMEFFKKVQFARPAVSFIEVVEIVVGLSVAVCSPEMHKTYSH